MTRRARTTLYHVTTAERAAEIVRSGFRDWRGTYGTAQEHVGVWFSDTPLEVNDGVTGDTVLEVMLGVSESAIADFEWVEEGKGYREWLIPADFVNRYGTLRGAERPPPSVSRRHHLKKRRAAPKTKAR